MHADSNSPMLADASGVLLKREVSDDIEIGCSNASLLPLVAVGFAMTLVSASIAFEWIGYSGVGSYEVLAGYAGLMLFGLATGRFAWTFLARKEPVILITPHGIRDLRIANAFILWDFVTEISGSECRGRKVVALKITPALQKQLSFDATRQNKFLPGGALEEDRIIINPAGLTMGFDALLQACRVNYCTDKRRTAVQQNDGSSTSQPS